VKIRDAFTLVELSITMTAGSALMILAIGLLHQSMSLASMARDRSDHQRTLERLAREFRRDVHHADNCTVTADDNALLVMPDEMTVTYVAETGRVTRRQRLGDKLARHDVFPFSTRATATFESLRSPNRAVLTVSSVSPVSDQARVDRRISAVVGRVLQHEQGEVSP
jgi:type II secretory pathway component PulJ